MDKKIFFVVAAVVAAIAGGAASIALSHPALAETTSTAVANGVAYMQSQPLDKWNIMALTAAGDPPTVASATANIETELSEGSSSASGVAGPILAATAMGLDPYDLGGHNYVADLEAFYSSSTGEIGSYVDDDAFALLALDSAGVSSTNPIIVGGRNYLLASSTQNADGGWPYTPGVESDSNDTAAAIWALMATGSHASDTAITNGLSYLKTLQDANGGFIDDPYYGTSTDAYSDAWVLSALYSTGQDPTSAAWTEGSSTAIDDLLSLQDTNASDSPTGYFAYQAGDTADESADATPEAIIALLGKYLPLGTVSAPTSTTVTITPATLPDATVGSAYSATVTAGDGDASDTFTWIIATDTLSSDFAVATSSAGITITGTPSATGAYELAVTATSMENSMSSSTANYTLTVDPAPASVSVASGGNADGGGGGGGTISSNEVSYRIEGPSSDLCDGSAAATTPLDVLSDAASSCGLTYHVTQYSNGAYVDTIGSYAASGANGWLYSVDGVQPSLAANLYNLKNGDSVVWSYGSGENTTATTATTTTTTGTQSSSGSNGTSSGETGTQPTTTESTSTAATSTVSTTPTSSPGAVLGASTSMASSTDPAQLLISLEQQLATLEFKVNDCSFQFDKNLDRGVSGADVQNLQTTLNYIPMFIGGSTIPVTGYFGSETQAAVTDFQNLWSGTILAPNGLTAGNGFVGTATRAVLNQLCAS